MGPRGTCAPAGAPGGGRAATLGWGHGAIPGSPGGLVLGNRDFLDDTPPARAMPHGRRPRALGGFFRAVASWDPRGCPRRVSRGEALELGRDGVLAARMGVSGVTLTVCVIVGK